MTNIWNAKDPTETVAYPDDWSQELGEDTIASYTITPTGTATITKREQTAQGLKFWIAGGDEESTTTFAVQVTTSSGQVLDRVYTLYVATGEASFLPTSTTKRRLVEQMFTECSINGWEYDIMPEEQDRALTRLDALMWELRGRGLELGYNFPGAIGAGDLDDPLGCPDQAFYGLSVLGAERLCPTMGKTMSRESRIALNSAMKAVRACTQQAPTMRLGHTTPLGSGNRWWPLRGAFTA